MAKYVTIEEAAQRLGKSVDDVREMMNSGELRGMMDGGTFKFKEEDIAKIEPAGGGKAGGGDEGKEDTLMTIDSDVLFAEGEDDQPADAAAETWIAADMENVFESEDFDLGTPDEEELGQPSSPEAAMEAEDLQPAPLTLSAEKDDTALGTVLMEDEDEQGAPEMGDEPVVSIDPESGIATVASPTPGVSRTHMIMVQEPEPRHKAFTPALVIATVTVVIALMAAWYAINGASSGLVEWIIENAPIFIGAALGVALIAGIVGFVIDRQKAANEAQAARLGR